MSWWFPRLNRFGEVISGNGTLLLDGHDLGRPGYSPCWQDDNHVIAASPFTGGTATIVNVRTGTVDELPWVFAGRAGNAPGVSAGQGSWCGWSDAIGLVTNDVVLDSLAASGSIDRMTGTLGYLTPYQSDTRRVVIDGFTVRQSAPADNLRLADGAATWMEWMNGRWKLWGRLGHDQPKPLGPLPLDEPEFLSVPVICDGQYWVVLQTAVGLVVFPWGDTDGYILEGEVQFPDAIWVDGKIRIVATLSNGTPVQHNISLAGPRTDLSTYHPSGGDPLPERPTITITDYNPKSGEVPPELAVKAICKVSGGPAERIIWSQQKDGGPWQVVTDPPNAPDDPDHTYRFSSPGTYGLKVRVEGPGGSDETGLARLVTVTKTPDVPTPPTRGERFWFAPNIGSTDMLQLFTNPEVWTAVRAKIGVFQFYLQHILNVGGDIGPNNYEAFRDAGAFELLTREGICIAVEQGSVKPGQCDAVRSAEMMLEAQQKITEAGGLLSFVSMDEPLVSGLDPTLCNQAVAQCAEATANFIHVAQQHELRVGWIEAWPHNSVDTMAEFLQQLDKRGARPAYWHLDIDRKRAQKEGKSIPKMLAECEIHAADRSMPLGVIFVGYSHDTDAQYCADVRSWAIEVQGYQPGLTHVITQSWATRGDGGHQDIPLNVPESDETKHTNLLDDVVELFV